MKKAWAAATFAALALPGAFLRGQTPAPQGATPATPEELKVKQVSVACGKGENSKHLGSAQWDVTLANGDLITVKAELQDGTAKIAIPHLPKFSIPRPKSAPSTAQQPSTTYDLDFVLPAGYKTGKPDALTDLWKKTLEKEIGARFIVEEQNCGTETQSLPQVVFHKVQYAKPKQ